MNKQVLNLVLLENQKALTTQVVKALILKKRLLFD
jgi:hypothetical protein